MTLVVLLVTVFFYGKAPEVAAVIAPDADQCQVLGEKVKTDLEKDGTVQAVERACFGVKEANKA